MSSYALGRLLALVLFPALVVCVIAGVRWALTRDAAKAKATFRAWWAWGIGVVLTVLGQIGQLANSL